MRNELWKEIDEVEQIQPGWYAVHYCWDVMEGSFVGVDYYDGDRWEHQFPWSTIAGPLDTEAEAQAFADANDISW